MIERIQEADKELRGIHRSTKGDSQHCPLCEKPMESMYKKDSAFHYWCSSCEHGWYIADLLNFSEMCLVGKREEARQIIIKKDKERDDADKGVN